MTVLEFLFTSTWAFIIALRFTLVDDHYASWSVELVFSINQLLCDLVSGASENLAGYNLADSFVFPVNCSLCCSVLRLCVRAELVNSEKVIHVWVCFVF